MSSRRRCSFSFRPAITASAARESSSPPLRSGRILRSRGPVDLGALLPTRGFHCWRSPADAASSNCGTSARRSQTQFSRRNRRARRAADPQLSWFRLTDQTGPDASSAKRCSSARDDARDRPAAAAGRVVLRVERRGVDLLRDGPSSARGRAVENAYARGPTGGMALAADARAAPRNPPELVINWETLPTPPDHPITIWIRENYRELPPGAIALAVQVLRASRRCDGAANVAIVNAPVRVYTADAMSTQRGIRELAVLQLLFAFDRARALDRDMAHAGDT